MNLLKKSEVIKESNQEDDIKSNIKALTNSSNFGNSMQGMIVSLMNSQNCLKITQDVLGRADILSVPIQISGADTIKTK